jgi:hypothetical protein
VGSRGMAVSWVEGGRSALRDVWRWRVMAMWRVMSSRDVNVCVCMPMSMCTFVCLQTATSLGPTTSTA